MAMYQLVVALTWVALCLWAAVSLRNWQVPVGAFRRLRRGLWLLRVATVVAFVAAVIDAIDGRFLSAAAWIVSSSLTAGMATFTRWRIGAYVELARLHAEKAMHLFALRNGLPLHYADIDRYPPGGVNP